ncbi:hypothetical protein HHI36_019921 [Cryptolaemus montrouzieri]|uniref:Uncharacterized protein n=1 Tax=Cryptolaemus montrouzieri TaxID=559131 RepID=A0ABD2N970_9CUCU
MEVINSNIKGPKTKEINCAITASEFNSYFNKIPEFLIPTPADSEKRKKYVTNVKSSDFGSIFLKPTTPEEILTTVSKRKNKSSCDYYGFNVRVLKRVTQSLADPLSKIINMSFEKGLFRSLEGCQSDPSFQKGRER